MNCHYDVAIIGAGILGLAHAWRAAVRGKRVVVLERSRRAQSASVRNFGMIWPIGQPVGELFEIALASRELWLQMGSESASWVHPCGSLHLAHREDELAVLEEYCQSRADGPAVAMRTPQQTLHDTPAAKPEGLLGSLHSTYELCVNPRKIIGELPAWLEEQYGVDFRFETHVREIADSQCITATGTCWTADQVIVCSGADLVALFPQAFANAGLRTCKLQMMRTVPQPSGWRMGPHLASGLTLRHYHSFATCPSLAQLKRRVATETPELDRFGIHVMASQDDDGRVILGDSHEYDDDLSPFDNCVIDELVIRELQKQFVFPDWTIDSHWHGYYIKHPTQALVQIPLQPNVRAFCSPGGAGMTLSFGWAEQYWNAIEPITS